MLIFRVYYSIKKPIQDKVHCEQSEHDLPYLARWKNAGNTMPKLPVCFKVVL